MCRICWRFRQGLILVRRRIQESEKELPTELHDDAVKLSDEARQRIQGILDSHSA